MKSQSKAFMSTVAMVLSGRDYEDAETFERIRPRNESYQGSEEKTRDHAVRQRRQQRRNKMSQRYSNF